MSAIKKNSDTKFNDCFVNPPPLQALIKMPEFHVKQTSFFWCNYSQKLRKIKMLLENPFISEENKASFMVNFSRFQRTMNAFKKLVRMWRIKKNCLIYQNTTDLKGVELNEYKPHLVIDLIEDGTIYSFYIHDLLKMWNMALRQRMYVIESPTKFKNPYTNMAFKLINLYNIYYKALFNGIKRPPLVDMHFNCRFSIKLLLYTYGTQLREWAITDYAETDDVALYHELVGVHQEHGYLLPQLRVSESFSDSIKMKQIKIYRPIIQAYCFMSYSTNNHLITKFTELFFKLVDAYTARRQSDFI